MAHSSIAPIVLNIDVKVSNVWKIQEYLDNIFATPAASQQKCIVSIIINGIDVKTKTQAQEIFMNSTGDISFLVARPPPPAHHAYEEDLDHLDDVGLEDEVGGEVVHVVVDHETDAVMKTSNRNFHLFLIKC